MTMTKSQQLRADAARIREAARRAESSSDMRHDMALADSLEQEANRLDGVTIQEPVRPAPEPRQYRSQAERVNDAMNKMEIMLGIKTT